ncbi:uncharacterized protein EV420DRAFT_715330 [Desarmillaria tabescens]|uniref:Uncharacterized protein n=1 Tax=Armillaria tabescens TaxID=1929756 RepID=A0AA39K102_ARMTA|nr:uncharacterized protein EV420DRAFT_715330 [Desarmillaria tabescens]KAK0451391.1 hypothetical protein EV420DRAFT_715330 [Desarmillaria tabescens]
MAPTVDYMAFPPIAALEAKIKAGSHEDVVDDMWLNVGSLYFTLADGFTVSGQSRPRVQSGQKIDVGWRKLVNGNVRVFIIEDASYAHKNSGATWDEKRTQLKGYLAQTRVAEPNFKKTLFGAVTIGKATQFFSYPYRQDQLQPLHDVDKAFEFKKHQERIDYYLTYIRDQIKAGA